MGVPSTWGVLTSAQQEVVGRLGAVEIGQRVYGDQIYVYRAERGRHIRYLLSGAGELVRKDDLGPRASRR
ncbi:MAG: hypothetical protein M3065_19055 [Actinomycetota bacterium]|nr:hypothetical protein [Actinomycetota bacterium]